MLKKKRHIPSIPRIIPAALAGVALLAIVGGCAGTTGTTSKASGTSSGTNSADANFVLKIGYGGSLCEAPVHMGVEKGFFKEERLNVETVKLASGTTFDAASSGKIDAGFALLASMVQPLSNGLQVKITTGLHTGCDKVLTKSGSALTTAKDFKGKKIGVPSMTSSPIIFAKRVLAAAGVSVSAENAQVEFVVYNQTDLPLALQNGAVDAIALNDPTATIAANQYGFNIVFDSATDKPYADQYCCAAFVTDSLLEEHPAIAEKYTRAMQKASEWIEKNKAETAQIQVKNQWVAGDADVNTKLLETYKYTPSVQTAYKSFGTIAKELQSFGMLGKSVDVTALQKNSFAFLSNLPDK